MSRKKIGQNLVQVSTYAPLASKMKLEAIAESQDKSLYALVREILEEYLEKQPQVEAQVEAEEEDGSNLL